MHKHSLYFMIYLGSQSFTTLWTFQLNNVYISLSHKTTAAHISFAV